MAEEETLLKKYNGLYLEIIMRYKDRIEEGETLYVAELPKLVTPSDEAVLSAVKNITKAFPSYNFEENFYDAAKEAHRYVKEAITKVSLPIQFWLRPSQTIGLESGDVFDKAVLLCSMLIALGNASSKIITTVKDEEKRFGVYCEFKGKIVFLDVEGGTGEFQSKDEMLAQFGIGKDQAIEAYEFNDKIYSNLA